MGLFQAAGVAFAVLGNSTESKRHSVALTDDEWTLYISISVGLVLLAGLMSGLTLGLMSLNVLDMEVCMACPPCYCHASTHLPKRRTSCTVLLRRSDSRVSNAGSAAEWHSTGEGLGQAH